MCRAECNAEVMGERVSDRSALAISNSILTGLRLLWRVLDQRLREALQRIQGFVGQVFKRYLTVHNLQRTLRITADLHLIAVMP